MATMRVVLIGAACAALLTPVALAAHGKVGTWEITTKMGGGGMPAMPDISKMPPEVQARMKAHGVQMNAGGGMTAKFCMTADQVNNDKPLLNHRGSCETENVKLTGNTFSANVVCKGQMNGKGHIEVTFDSAEHYSGRQTMSMNMNGQQMTHDMTMDARWLTPACTVPAETLPGQAKPSH
jgi:hypothetical protein